MVDKEMDEELSTETLTQFLSDQFPELDNEISRNLIIEAEKATDEIVDSFAETEFETYSDFIFGVHGLGGDDYDFDIRVEMPGEVLETNAHSTEGDVLHWEFTGNPLDQILIARSRKIYPLRIARGIGLLLLIAGLFAFRWHLHGNKKLGESE